MGASDERMLAATLAALSDAELADVLAARDASPQAGWRDFFDLAAELLSPAGVDRAVRTLPRTSIEALIAGEPDAEAQRRMLVRPDGAPYAAAAERLEAAGGPGPVPAPEAEAADAEVAVAAERAFHAIGSLTDILLWTLSAPLARIGAGPVTVSDRRRLIESGSVEDADTLEDLLGVAAAAGLIRDVQRTWQATASAERWIAASTPERWAALATGFVSALPDGIRANGRHVPPSAWAGAYPLDPDWPDAVALLRRRAQRIGLLTADGLEPPWTRGLRESGAPELGSLSRHLPTEIDRVYLQADLTAIAPGPLLPALEQRLRGMAVRETRAQASTYRFSAESLASAVASGETRESLRSFLGELSLTGIPQPLAYLIDRATANRSRLRVGSSAATGLTTVTAEDADLLATVAVDQALRPLGLVPHEGTLISRADRDAVYWSLAEARYPVVAVDEDGAAHTLSRRVAPEAAAPVGPAERYARLIATLRSSAGPDAETAWLARELEQAVRTRAAVEVTVRLPDGNARVFSLEATGLGGGRLRGRDRAADVERTVPLSSIEGVRPL
ncbi:helicase-associated domain-containing protein [Microbacterium sp. SORGH_AS_0888]|uniref:helicase-associated domain-containing protein n=1 Tax=Microbacterium sp. SORGH_AS_0888 TaxID=3041791 RepID=UPI0027856057|nr:helicase-associated domain-containing protein [Microbacterium sp. SORGH_AS_0888]MDQ1131099.1 hypothetical protein [Microbacterium sp. SORGH_AS_0888]